MNSLRVRLSRDAGQAYRANLELLGPADKRHAATVHFVFNLEAAEREDIRWYLEDYLDYPFDPAPQTAARVERQMADIGAELFSHLFESTSRARSLWRLVAPCLNETRITIHCTDDTAHSLPWELLLEPSTGLTLATEARAFVRVPQIELGGRRRRSKSIRLLLVIARPGGSSDVRFRSVALGIVATLAARPEVEIDVLRPATWAHLTTRLGEAAAADRAYDVIHFDGHGTYGDRTAAQDNRPPTHARGYAVFDDAPIPGIKLGKLLVSSNVRLLMLNACRSAYVEAPAEQEERPGGDHSRAFQSLADEITAGGVPGVVAMQYNIKEDAAAHFYDHLYGALVQGATLGEAVNRGRRAMRLQPLRQGFDRRSLRDWVIPVVYEASQSPLFTRSRRRGTGLGTVGANRQLANPAELPAPPTTGFIGQDDSLLDLDRAFTTHRVVLLHGFAGSGKSATAAEFARWYSATGGVERVVYTSFERYQTIERVVDAVEQAISEGLQARGTDWLILTDEERIITAGKLLQGSRCLWIWDNVECIAGFPGEGDSVWTSEEGLRLASLLQRLPAWFLLTSRRADERLFPNAESIGIRPLPMTDRVVLASELAAEHDRSSPPILAWRSLLEFSGGNPLTVRVTVGQALRDGLETAGEIEDFVAALRSGSADLVDDQSQGRMHSLAASLSYGLEHAFDEQGRAVLALLHLFQGFVDPVVLVWMGGTLHGVVPELARLDRAELDALLDRAADVGLLTRASTGGYLVHPAVPWYLKRLFDEHYANSSDGTDAALRATRAYAEAVGALGGLYQDIFQAGVDSRNALKLHESNLLQARVLAIRHRWFEATIGTMQGLRSLYKNGRAAEWARIVRDTVPHFVNVRTDEPFATTSETHWNIVTEFRVQLLRAEGNLAEAKRLQQLRDTHCRKAAKSALEVGPDALSDEQRTAIEHFATSLGESASILQDQRDPACIELLDEAISLWQRIRERAEEARATFNLGNAVADIRSDPDTAEQASKRLDRAEQSFKRSLQLRRTDDRIGRSNCYSGLGSVDLERFRMAQDDETSLRFAASAVGLYQHALRLTTVDDIRQRATLHNQLGVILDESGQPLKAADEMRKSLRYEEAMGDALATAQARYNMALVIGNSRRFGDALLWANRAFTDYVKLGERASDYALQAAQLIAEIEALMKEDGGGS